MPDYCAATICLPGVTYDRTATTQPLKLVERVMRCRVSAIEASFVDKLGDTGLLTADPDGPPIVTGIAISRLLCKVSAVATRAAILRLFLHPLRWSLKETLRQNVFSNFSLFSRLGGDINSVAVLILKPVWRRLRGGLLLVPLIDRRLHRGTRSRRRTQRPGPEVISHAVPDSFPDAERQSL